MNTPRTDVLVGYTIIMIIIDIMLWMEKKDVYLLFALSHIFFVWRGRRGIVKMMLLLSNAWVYVYNLFIMEITVEFAQIMYRRIIVFGEADYINWVVWLY